MKTTTPPLETIGQRLARLRKERGITQVELAGELGVTQSHVPSGSGEIYASTAS